MCEKVEVWIVSPSAEAMLNGWDETYHKDPDRAFDDGTEALQSLYDDWHPNDGPFAITLNIRQELLTKDEADEIFDGGLTVD